MEMLTKKKKILMVFLYCILVFIFFESMSRLLLSVRPFMKRIRAYNNDSYWKNSWLKGDKGKGVPFCMHIYDPIRGWALKPNIRDMISCDETMTVSSNSKGIRGKVEYAYKKPEGKIRILVFGDSFTFGQEVNDTETYAYYLQQILADTEVINLGIMGYGHDQMLLYLKEEGVRYKPDIVILGYMTMDEIRNLLSFRDYAKPRLVLVGNKLKLTNVPVPTPQSILRNDLFKPKIFTLLSLLKRRKGATLVAEKRKITEAILAEIAKTINSVGAMPIFIYLPSRGEIEDLTGQRRAGEDFFFELCKRIKVRCFSLCQYFQDNIRKGNALQAEGQGHWDAKEHRLAAEGIKEYLIDNKIKNIQTPR
jgi:hypothetical protein